MPFEDVAANAWFAENLQPHAPVLRAWLRSRYSDGCDVEDLVQETFIKAWQAHSAGTLRAPKAFIFTTARNLALNQLRHRNVENIDGLAEIDDCGVLDGENDLRDTIARSDELAILAQAIQSLPTRCRQILTLRKLYGYSQKETAAELGIAEHTVESQSKIALRKIGEYFARFGRPIFSKSELLGSQAHASTDPRGRGVVGSTKIERTFAIGSNGAL